MKANLSTFVPIMLILLLLSFFFSNSKSFFFLLTIPIALLSTLFLVTLKKKKWSKNESIVQDTIQKEKLQPSFDVSEVKFNQQSVNDKNHEKQDETQLDYSFPLDKTFEFNVHEHMQQDDFLEDSSFRFDSERSNGSIIVETFELNVHEDMQQDNFLEDSSFHSDSERSNVSIVDETFEIDQNEYRNASSRDSLASDTNDEDDDYDYDSDYEGFNKIMKDTNYNLNDKDGSLLSYSPLVNHISDDDGYYYEEEDSLIEIRLPSRHLSNLTGESKQKMEFQLPDFLSEFIFKQQSFVQLLEEINDMNDDENLIEIDISM